MTQKRKKATQLNKDYFQSLITTSASLENIQLHLTGFMIGVVFLAAFWLGGSAYNWGTPYDPISFMALVCVIYMGLWSIATGVPTFKKIVYRHQDIAGVFQTLFIILLELELVLLGLFLATYRQGHYEFYAPTTAKLLLVFLSTYVLVLLYNVFWLKRQLKVGFSTEKTQGLYRAKSVVRSTASLGVIFGGSMLGKYMTADQSNIFGIGANLLFIVAFTRLTVLYARIAILKRHDKSYWEEYEVPEALTDKQKRKIIWVFVTLLEVVIVACIGHFNEELLKMSQLISIPIAILMIAIFADWIIRFVRWIRKK